MTGSKVFLLGGLGVILCALLTACGGKTPANGPSALNILTSSPLPVGAEGDAYSQTLIASGGLPPYVWSIDSGSLPPGFNFSAGGVLSGTPPTGSAGNYGFTVRVTDSQSPTKAYQIGSMSLTINPPFSFSSTTLPNAVIAVAYSSAVTASGGITCSGTVPYTYALVPNSSPLPAGLTLNSDGTITGTPTGPIGTYPFTVQATDCFPTTATANFTITVTGKIQGNYAFSLSGYNQQGQAFYLAGSFVADGNGNITSGVFDRNGNDSIGPMTNVAITPGSGANGQCPIPSGATGSVYCVGRSEPNGSTSGNNLGTIMIASPLGTYSFSVSVSLLADSKIILADPNNPGVWGSGTLASQGQTLSGISLASANFAFGLWGLDSGGSRYAGAGYFITDPNGNIASGNGLADINDNGTVQAQTPLTGSVSSVSPTTGRGTATFTIGTSTLNYAFYVIPAGSGKLFNSVVAVQTDPVSNGSPLTLASMSQRSPAGGSAFTVKSLNATTGGTPNGDVFELNGVSNSGGGSIPDISLGVATFDGNGNITGYAYDENKGGTLTIPAQNSYTGTYSVDTISGRVTVNLNGIANQPVWYLVSQNAGFVVGTDPNVTAGNFEPQNVTQPITILYLFGNFYGGTTNPVLPSVINSVLAATASPPPPPGTGNGSFTGTFDSSGTTGVMMDQMFTDSFCLADSSPCPTTQQANSTTGRMLIVDSNGKPVDILYPVSAGASGVTGTTAKDVLLSTDSNPSLTAITR